MVTGHTPTQQIVGNLVSGYIFKGNNHIANDCVINSEFSTRERFRAIILRRSGQSYLLQSHGAAVIT